MSLAVDKNFIIDVLMEEARDLQLISTSLEWNCDSWLLFSVYSFTKIVQTISNVIAIVIVHSENK